jgi:uncharacterized membrane protein YvlD (DUF360 family)
MLMLVARWSESLDVNNFWSAVFAAIVISVVTKVVTSFNKKVTKP